MGNLFRKLLRQLFILMLVGLWLSSWVSVSAASADTSVPDGFSTHRNSGCESGKIWTWTTGPQQPEIASQAQQALRQVGISSTVVASMFGEKDACGNFEPFAVDFSINLVNQPDQMEARQQELSKVVISVLSQFSKPRLGNVKVAFGSGKTLFFSSTTNAAKSAVPSMMQSGSTVVLTKKVFILVFDPLLSNNQHLSAYMNWTPYQTIVQGVIDSFQTASHGHLNFSVVDTQVITNGWPVKIDSFRYDESTYLAVIQDQISHHEPDTVDYDIILDNQQFDLCGKLNRGEIDELWMIGGPWFGFYESRLVGPNAYSFNSPPVEGTHGCNKLLPIMGLNYERGVAEAVHSFGHRAEAAMTQTYGSWEENRTLHNWDRFGLVKAQSPNYTYSGCGSVHYPPNGVEGYDYSNPGTVLSNCDDFFNYPNLGDPLAKAKSVTCSIWGCDELGYLLYWFGHFPSRAGCGSDGVANDWWKYIADVNAALAPSQACVLFQDVSFNYWARNYIERLYNAGITGGCGTNPLMYCPTAIVTRDQMAVFLLKGKHGSGYVPSTATGLFQDVPKNYWAANWIEQLAAEGITSGCSVGPKLYCPGTSVTRDQMAVFLLRAKHGSNYIPPKAKGVFQDVPTNYWAADWIEQLAAEGITSGCSVTPKLYCPGTPVMRDQMAVFLVKNFNLP